MSSATARGRSDEFRYESLYGRRLDCPLPARYPASSRPHRRKGLKPALSRTMVERRKHQHHVIRSILVSPSAIRNIKISYDVRSISLNCSLRRHPYACMRCSKTTSSGDSSPSLSLSPFTFSSRESISSRSPPSSRQSLSSSPALSHLQVRRTPRIQVSSLLADPHTRTYHLEVVQHPVGTAAFETANLSRLPLTPPIIVQLTVRDTSGNSIVPQSELPFLVAHLSLYSNDGRPLDMGSSIGRGHTPPTLYGNLVSSVEQLEDLQGNSGLFFLFSDVSIRWRGQYQIGISLLRLYRPDPIEGVSIAPHGATLAEARTHAFSVVDRAEYVAAPLTRLTQCFLRQGARMFNYMTYP